MGYATVSYYTDTYKGVLTPDIVTPLLEQASDIVDQLTYYRIRDFESLTAFQKEMVQKAVCFQADFLYDYEIPAGVSSYSVNGVSMSFEGIKDVSSKTMSCLTPTGLRYGGW